MRILKTACMIAGIATLCTSTGCSSSEELLHPASRQYSYAKNSRFVDGAIITEEKTQQKTEQPVAKTGLSLNSETIKFLKQKYSAVMNVVPEYIRSVKLYNFIEEWYGVKYRIGGNDKSGIDCSAFVKQLYDNVFRINLLRTSFDQYNTVTYVWQKHNLKEGDLVFFRIHGKRITHVGVYLMNGYFVHASLAGVIISSLNEDYWSRRFAGAGYIDIAGKLKTNG